MSCCFKSSSLILNVILRFTTKTFTVKLLVVNHKILYYAGEGASPLLKLYPITKQQQFSKPVAALLLLAKAVIDQSEKASRK